MLKILLFSLTLLEIKVYIENRFYQGVVEALNTFHADINSYLAKITRFLEENRPNLNLSSLLLMMVSNLAQSVILLYRYKPKIVKRNQVVIRGICL